MRSGISENYVFTRGRQSPLIAPGPTADQILDQQRLDELTALLDKVNPRTREIYLAHRSGYTYAEIADHMGVAEIPIKGHTARAHMIIMSLTDRNGYTQSEKCCQTDPCTGKHSNSGPPAS